MNTLRDSLPQRLVAALFSLAIIATACGSATELQGDTAAPREQPSSPAAAANTPSAPVTTGTDEAAEGAPANASEATRVPEEPTMPPGQIGAFVATGGAVDHGNQIEISVGPTVATNNDIEAAIIGINEPSDENWLITTIGVESLTPIRRTPDAHTFVLRRPDGQLIPATAIYTEIGQSRSELDINGRTLSEVRLAFPTNQLVDDVDGWHLLVGEEDVLPIVVPLDGPAFERHYPLALATVAPSQIDIADGEIIGCPGATFDSVVEQAVVGLGAAVNSTGDFTRVPAAERMVTIDVRFSALDPDATDSDCAWTSQWPDFILYVDGRPSQPFQAPGARIRGQALLTAPLTFQIPADATTIELVGGSTEMPIATWELSLPPAVGEPEATLVPVTAGAQSSLPTAVGDRPTSVSTQSLATGGATGSMFDVEIALGETVATNTAPSDFVAGITTDEPDDRTWLVTQIALENTNDELYWTIDEWDVVLVDPDGRPRSASLFFDRSGALLDLIRFSGAEDFVEASIAIETNGLVTNATGWALQISHGEGLPIELPLAGPSASLSSQFPVSLEAGQTTAISRSRTSCPNDLVIFDFEVGSARLALEGINTSVVTRDFLFERAREGQRIIVVDLLVTNPISDSNSPCSIIQDLPHELLEVDGRLLQSIGSRPTSLNPLETRSIILTYVIPDNAETASLLDSDGEVLATWDLRSS